MKNNAFNFLMTFQRRPHIQNGSNSFLKTNGLQTSILCVPRIINSIQNIHANISIDHEGIIPVDFMGNTLIILRVNNSESVINDKDFPNDSFLNTINSINCYYPENEKIIKLKNRKIFLNSDDLFKEKVNCKYGTLMMLGGAKNKYAKVKSKINTFYNTIAFPNH